MEMYMNSPSTSYVVDSRSTSRVKKPYLIEVPTHMNKDFGERATAEMLVEHAKRGNQKAFDLLVIKYQSSVARVVSNYIRDRSIILDVVQDTFIKAYRGLGSFRSDSTFYTWIHRIAINTAINQIKNTQRKHNTISINNIEQMDLNEHQVSNDDPVTSAYSKSLTKHLNKILNGLPIELKTALLLKEVEGFKYEEIAKIVGSPPGTIKSRISRARERVVAEMNDIL